MHIEHAIRSSARELRVGIVVSRYHSDITGAMRDAAVRTFLEAGGVREDIELIESPGAFELIGLCNGLARRGDLDAILAIGCIIAGETRHDQYLATAVANGIAQIIIKTGVPISFGVLTCQSIQQARERSGPPGTGKGNKGEEAMLAAIESACALRAIREGGLTQAAAGGGR